MGDPVEAPVQCTCGNRLNNLTYEKWKVDHGSNEPTLDESNLSNITSPGRLKTDFFQNPGTSKTTPMPFDASFIQVKPPFPGCSTIFAKTLSYPNHMFDGSNHFATKDNLQTEAAPPNNCQADFLLRDSNLCKAATSDTDPPPLCMSCLRRYV